nr:MAG TPA: hypothetical protein [Caudoviricetes sp.]
MKHYQRRLKVDIIFFYVFCRRAFRRANVELMKRLHIKILRIDFWDMETDNKKVMKVGKYE